MRAALRISVLRLVAGCLTSSACRGETLTDRIQRDLSRGEDVVVTSYVGLWFTNPREPARNLYWGNLYGHAALFDRRDEIRAQLPFVAMSDYEVVLQRTFERDPISVRVLRAELPAGSGSAARRPHLVVVNLAYSEMERALLDLGLQLKTGALPPSLAHEADLLPWLSKSYVMGYWGHNVYYGGVPVDELESVATTVPDAPRGVFVVGCQSAKWFPQKFLGRGIEPVLFTTTNMAPEAYIALALYDALGRGLSLPEIRHNAARAYQRYQKLRRPPVSLFTNDPARIARLQAPIPGR